MIPPVQSVGVVFGGWAHPPEGDDSMIFATHPTMSSANDLATLNYDTPPPPFPIAYIPTAYCYGVVLGPTIKPHVQRTRSASEIPKFSVHCGTYCTPGQHCRAGMVLKVVQLY